LYMLNDQVWFVTSKSKTRLVPDFSYSKYYTYL